MVVKRLKRRRFFESASVTLLALLIFSFVTSLCSADSSVLVPSWLKNGTYAEYSFVDGMIFVSGVTEDFEKVRFVNGTFRWECVNLDENIATLNLSFEYIQTEINGKALEENKTVLLVEDVYVDTVSRAVYLQNGTLLGTTTFWLPANPSTCDEIVLWDVPPDRIIQTVSNLSEIQTRVRTPQGSQYAFKIEKQGTINGTNVFFNGLYDFDTGVLDQNGLEREPFVRALEISNIFWNGVMHFSSTNIDLGPSINSSDYSSFMFVIMLAVAFVIVFVAVYRGKKGNRYRKKRRR
jgi:hypothetical protein